MPWFVIDDSAHMHPKIVAATNAGFGLWSRCGSYASQHLTDGIVPGVIAKMYGSKPQVSKLVAAGLWHEHGHTCSHPKCRQPAPGDYYMHDYLVYNPSRREVTARREREAEKKRKWRAEQESRANRSGNDDDPNANREGIDGDSSTNRERKNHDAAGQGDASQGDDEGTRARAFPSPPLPSQEGGEGREPSAGSRGRASEPALSLIAADWQPSSDDVRAAQLARSDAGREQLSPQQIDTVTRKFVRRMADDQVRAAGFGGRWVQWAERERTEPAGSLGSNVVQLPGMTRSQQQRAGLDRLRQQMNGGSS
ncbi:hypothetical protein [Streptomyces sp. NBC_01373]|uniref:hypothetical protein n=1 Tax=Streptomyces sp. NBC_01373 TaxID=2903843 RepID=UPI00225639B5|nr:hypothetical protein [Streptomyces sp. NBC_01373]MCX4705678.1 hypothetical protein [Streptomyces sp. NBC_01373]